MKDKIVEYIGDFHGQGRDAHLARYITSKEEFINAILTSVKFLDLSSDGRGDWENNDVKQWFFNGGYSNYLMPDSIKDFNGEDWYLFEYEKEYLECEAIFIIKLETIKDRYSAFIHQFT